MSVGADVEPVELISVIAALGRPPAA